MAERYSPHPINLRDKLALFSDHWSPKTVAVMNNYEFKLVKLQGDFTWHHHADTDEVFLVIEGQMTIEMRDRSVTLAAGELFVVPRGLEHRPHAAQECHILLIEPGGVVNTGSAGGEQTATPEWI
jgi:mannose-6-phosphate isomerase-like protein (cupin superfamily)